MADAHLPDDTGRRRAVTAFDAFPAYARTGEDGLCHLTLAVDGVNCAHCIQKIESALAREPAIRQARVNFSTRRLALAWAGDAAQAADFARTVENLGYRVQPFDAAQVAEGADAQARALLLAMAVAGFASGNIMLLSFALWTTSSADMGEGTRLLMYWVSALIAVPTAVFSGRPFYASALAALRKGRTNMDVPISIAVILTTIMSLFGAVTQAEHVYFDSVVMLLFLLLVGRYLDLRARQNARSAATDLLALLSGTAVQITETGEQRVIPIRDVREGMTLRVAMGANIPADATVIAGESDLDTSLVTGESVPRPVRPGDRVYAGVLNISAPLTLRVAKVADESLLADIVRLMEKAEQGQARYVRLADRIARLYTPVVHLLALVAFLFWITLGGMAWQPALMIAVTVLIITCPCALGLAVPVVQVLATGLLMKRGVLVKSGDAFERLSAIDTLLLDKTGTLTVGKPVLEPGAEPDALQLAASLAAHSQHPLSKALAAGWSGGLLPLDGVQEHVGQGLEVTHGGHRYRLGHRRWTGAPAEEEGAPPQLELWLARDGEALQRFTFSDPPREDAREVLDRLKQAGLRLILLSGDRKTAVAVTAQALGLTEAEGELTPTDKCARLEALKREGHHVGMVGDGLNDAPVLAGADVSLSPSTAIDMAQNAADIIFMGEKLAPVLLSLTIARRTQTLVRQNIALSLAYNVVAVPLAMLGIVTPLIAALAMSASSLTVIGNAFRLKKGLAGGSC